MMNEHGCGKGGLDNSGFHYNDCAGGPCEWKKRWRKLHWCHDRRSIDYFVNYYCDSEMIVENRKMALYFAESKYDAS